LAARRDEVLEVARRAGYVDVKVFGSVARGEDGPGSDIDLMVTPVGSRSLFRLMRLGIDLSDLLGEPVDVVFEPDLRPVVAAKAAADAAAL
jgi:predicted nucleotidyltransferase